MAVETASAAQLICDALEENAFDGLIHSSRRLAQLFKSHAVGVDEHTADLLIGHCGVSGEVGNGLYYPFFHYSGKIQQAAEPDHGSYVDKFLEACDSQSQWARLSEFRHGGMDRERALNETKVTAMDRCHDGLRAWLNAQEHLSENDRVEFEEALTQFEAESARIKGIIDQIRHLHGAQPWMN